MSEDEIKAQLIDLLVTVYSEGYMCGITEQETFAEYAQEAIDIMKGLDKCCANI